MGAALGGAAPSIQSGPDLGDIQTEVDPSLSFDVFFLLNPNHLIY